MAVGIVQQVGEAYPPTLPDGHTTQSATLPSPPTAGNLLVLVAVFTEHAITEPVGWTVRRSVAADTTNISMLTATKVACSGESATVTVSVPFLARRSNLHVYEVNGGWGGDVAINSQPEGTFGSVHTFPDITPTAGVEALILAAIDAQNAYGISSGPSGGYSALPETVSSDGASDRLSAFSQHTASASGSYSGGNITYAAGTSTRGTQMWFKAALDPGTCPVAAFSGTPLTGSASLNVDFTDASTNSPTSWAWDFGDGGTSTSQNPSHIYVVDGTFTVTLTVTNAFGSDVETKVGYIVVGLPVLSAPRGLSGAPEYVIELFNSGATFGPNAKIGEVWDARNVGWSRYDRLSGKAFFTLAQTSAVLPLMEELLTHIAIWRITPFRDDLVYRGVFIDRNATGDDVICDCFDYISLLSISRSGFKTLYPTKLLGSEIVSPEWLLAKNASSSPLGFVTTGTIQDPLGTDGVTPIKTNAQFGTLDQTRLQIFFDLSEMGRANTINHVTYEIDLTNTFHFYKNRGVPADIAFVLGGNITDYQWMPGKTRYRNDVATIGVAGSGGAAEIVATNAAEITAKGRRQDVTTLKTLAGISGGGTEADQQKAALERELKRLVQQTSGLALKVARGKVEPYVGWTMCDTAKIEISNGDDLITDTRRIVGVRCMFTEAGEDIDVIVNEIAS